MAKMPRQPPQRMFVHPDDIYSILLARKGAFMSYLNGYLNPDEIKSLIAEKILATRYDPNRSCKPTTYGTMVVYRYLLSYARRHKIRWENQANTTDLAAAPETSTTPPYADGPESADAPYGGSGGGWLADVMAVMPTDRHRAMILYLQAGRDGPNEQEIRVRWGVSHHEWRALRNDTIQRVKIALIDLGLRPNDSKKSYDSIMDFFASYDT